MWTSDAASTMQEDGKDTLVTNSVERVTPKDSGQLATWHKAANQGILQQASAATGDKKFFTEVFEAVKPGTERIEVALSDGGGEAYVYEITVTK